MATKKTTTSPADLISKLEPLQETPDIPRQRRLELLAALATDRVRCGEIARIMQPEHWGDLRKLAEPVLGYVAKHKCPPLDHLNDLLDAGDVDKARVDELKAVLEEPIHNPDYLMEVMYGVAKGSITMKYARMLTEASLREDTNRILALTEELHNDLLVASPLNLGVRASDDEWFFADREDDGKILFPMKVDHLDTNGYGARRRRLMLLRAPYGHGKTFFLMWMAVCAADAGLNVTFFTLEDDPDDVRDRLQMMLYMLGNGGRVFPHYRFGEAGDVEERPDVLFTIHDKEKLRELAANDPRRERLQVVGLYEDVDSVLNVENTIDHLSQLEQFNTDVCVVDYCDRLGWHGDNKEPEYERLRKKLVALRNLGRSRNMSVITAEQTNKEGAKKKTTPGGGTSAGSFAKNWVADLTLTLKRDDDNIANNTAFMTIDKSRGAFPKERILISQNPSIGQFVVDSKVVGKSYAMPPELNAPVNDEIAHDDDASSADFQF